MESSELRRALLQACSDTVQVAVCVNADSARGAAALALVFWRGSGHVRIEVGSKDAPGGQTWTSREIDFSPRDAALERWRAAGYAAGTLASLVVRGTRARGGAETQPPEGPAATGSAPTGGARTNETGESAEAPAAQAVPAPETVPPPPPVAPAPSPHAAERERATPSRASRTRPAFRWSFDAMSAVGPGISESTLRAGGLVRINRAWGGPFVTASFGYSREPTAAEGFSAHWLTPTIGAGYVAALGGAVTVETRGEFIAERVEAFAQDPVIGDSSRAWLWLLGGRTGAAIAWAPVESIALVLGGDVVLRGPATDIVMRNRVRATVPIATYAAEGGLRFMLR